MNLYERLTEGNTLNDFDMKSLVPLNSHSGILMKLYSVSDVITMANDGLR